MTKTKLEILVDPVAEKWSEIKLNTAGEPVYASNGGKIGRRIHIMRVSETTIVLPPPTNNAPEGDGSPITFEVKL